MLNLSHLQDQIAAFHDYQAETLDRRSRQQGRALQALQAAAAQWRDLRAAVREAQPRRLVAEMRERPDRTHAAPERPTPVTVVASDGSQIYPDRHIEPTFFLLNVSRIAFQYGTTEPPLLEAEPDLRFREELGAHFDEVLASVTTEVVAALRDEKELEELLAVARTAQIGGRPLVAVADGTLIRWMIRGMQNRTLEETLIRRYTRMLQAFRDDELPLCSYISMPGNTEVVNLLRFSLGELDAPPPPGGTPPSGDGAPGAPSVELEGLLDRALFTRLLAPGERSALFTSASHIQRSYPPGNRICYFYVKVPAAAGPGEIGRVEVPEWIADDPALVDRIHGVILSECAKGDGYPLILSEAHERAVIRAAERESFFRLLERRLRRAGLPSTGSEKRRSKRVPRV